MSKMNIQKTILNYKNQIAFLSLFLIVIAFSGHYLLGLEKLSQIALMIASIIGIIPIAIQAYQSIRVKVISIDVLVTIAVIGAFVIKNYEESAIVTFLFLFGSYLEKKTLNKTRSAIKELTEMAPETALKKMSDGMYQEVSINLVEVGDFLQVKTGSKVPVDGKVIEGEGSIDEASITGESVPVNKKQSDHVFAGTILENGTLHIIAEKVGEDTTFGKIIELVESAQDSKSEAERFIDKFSTFYTPLVLVLAIIVYLIWQDIELAITILVLGCPGALVIGVPVSNVAGIGNGAKQGILLKGSEVIHDFSKIDTIVFDKTGTLTIGKPVVSSVEYYGADLKKTLGYLYSIEKESLHPLAKAILDYIGEPATNYRVLKNEVVKGGGIIADIEGIRIVVGNQKLMIDEHIELDQKMLEDIKNFELKGHSIVLTAVDNELELLMCIKDQIRPDVKKQLDQLRKQGAKNLIILSGDNQGTVGLVSKELGMTEAYGNMLPEDKQAFIKKLQREHKIVAFVGDGINDSPSLATAQVGIAMGNGTDVAIETGDVVLMNSDISKLPHAFGLAKATARNMKQNIGIAIGVVLWLIISLLFSEWMNMSIGMLVHEASILIVILNGMRLLKYKRKPTIR
nr:heavy metal translocating P-type ATPase [Haploplasma axanthum]